MDDLGIGRRETDGLKPKDLKNHDDAVRLAKIGGVDPPSPEEERIYTPLGAVARAVIEKYESTQETLLEFMKRRGIK